MGTPKPISKGQGDRHTVTVVPNRYLWHETTYGSLSTIAWAIGAERKCWHGSLPAASGDIEENKCTSRAFRRLVTHCRPSW
jgi:hypothetical protein